MPLIRLGMSPLGGGSLPQGLTVATLPFTFGTTRLGTSVRKFRGTIQLGRYVLGGGGLTPPDPRNASMLWSAGASVTFLPQVNGVTDQFTSRPGVPGTAIGASGFDTPKPKLGLAFTLGIGGVIRYIGETDSPQFDGATDVAIDAVRLIDIVGTGWFQWRLDSAPLIGTSPFGTVSRIDIRVSPYEYRDGKNWLATPGLYYPPYNARHLGTDAMLSADAMAQNPLTTYVGAMPQWVLRVPVIAQYTRINVQNTVSIQTGVSSFSGTLTGTTPSGTVTFRNSEFAPSSYLIRPAIYLISGSINIAAINMDGATDVAISGSQVSQSNITMDGTFDWVLDATRSLAGSWSADGATGVSITPLHILYGPWSADGVTDVEFTSIGVFDTSITMDGTVDVSITPFRVVYGPWNGDGVTDVAIDTLTDVAGNFTMDGQTDIAIDTRQTYTFGNTFTMDGRTDFAMSVSQSYAGFLTMDGTTNVVIAQTIATLSGEFQCDGATDFTCDTVADYFININMDGATSVAFGAIFIPNIEIVITGVGDMFVQASAPYQTNLYMDGTTDCQVTSRVNAAGFLEIYTGLQTDVQISASKIVTVFLNMDGTAAVFINVAQDQFGSVIFDQIDQDLSALGTYIFSDGSTLPAASSTFNPIGTLISQAPDYIWGIIDTQTGIGAPDFVPLGGMNFTASGKTMRSGDGPDWLGYHNHKYAFGFTRPSSAIFTQKSRDFTRDEWVRFNFYVSSAIDNTLIPDSIGFSASGVSALGGDGLVGRDVQKYVTFAVLTHAYMTQESLEVLATGDPQVNITQTNYEMLWIPDSRVHMTQLAEEILYLANLAAIQQVAVETLADSLSASRYGVIQQVAVETMVSIKAVAFVTEVAIEGFQGAGDPNVNCTEVALEILTYAQQFFNATGLIQQSAIETIHNSIAPLSVNQAVLETAHGGDPKARVQQAAIETVHNNDRRGLIGQVAVENLANSTTWAGVIEQVAVEMLVRPEYDPTVASLVNNPRYHT